jgi:hypothetical protein
MLPTHNHTVNDALFYPTSKTYLAVDTCTHDMYIKH